MSRFIRENVVSPYHDRFDFEVVLDPSDGGRPVDLNSCSSSGAPFSADRHSSSLGREGFSGMRHLAVIVAREDRQLVPTAEEDGGGWRLSGNMELKVETLELEGYEVRKHLCAISCPSSIFSQRHLFCGISN